MRNFEIKNNDSLSRKGRWSQTGRSMIEMLGVLAIIGVLSVGGIAGYSKAMKKYRINKAIEQITLISGNVRTFFRGNYAECNYADVVRKAKLFPDEMWNDNTPLNVFGHSVWIDSAAKSSRVDWKAFMIMYDTPNDSETCIELLSHDWRSVGVTGIALFSGNYTAYSDAIPWNMEKVVTVCTAVENNDIDPYSSIHFYIDVNSNCWNETMGNTCS